MSCLLFSYIVWKRRLNFVQDTRCLGIVITDNMIVLFLNFFCFCWVFQAHPSLYECIWQRVNFLFQFESNNVLNIKFQVHALFLMVECISIWWFFRIWQRLNEAVIVIGLYRRGARTLGRSSEKNSVVQPWVIEQHYACSSLRLLQYYRFSHFRQFWLGYILLRHILN